MKNSVFLPDSIKYINQVIEVVTPEQKESLFNIISSIATIIIAVINIVLVIYIFNENSRKNDTINERNRRVNLLKTLVLDYSMKHFYQFFSEIIKKLEQLKISDLAHNQKKEINEDLLAYSTQLRQNFIDSLLAIDKKLYSDILKEIDNLTDSLTINIFDPGINLSHEPKYVELITNKLTETKTKIIQILFSYSGD